MTIVRWRSARAAAMAGLLASSLSGTSCAAAAGLEIDLDIGNALHGVVRGENLRARILWSAARPELVVTADTLRFKEPVGRVDAVRITCPGVEWSTQRVRCPDARISARLVGATLNQAPLAFDWDRQAATVSFSGAWPGLFGARGHLQGLVGTAGARLAFDLDGLDLRQLVGSGWFPASMLPVAIGGGSVGLEGSYDTRGASPRLRADLQVSGLEFTDSLGLRAGEEISATATVRLAADGWDVHARFTQGAVFIDPWFLDFTEVDGLEAMVSQLRLPGPVDPGWQAGAVSVVVGEHGSLEGADLAGTTANLDRGLVLLEARRMDTFGGWFVSPFLAGTALGATRFEGALSGAARFGDGRLRSLSLRPENLEVADAAGRFELRGVGGQIDWSEDAPSGPSFLRVGGGSLFGMPLGPFQAGFQLKPRSFELTGTLDIPLLDGGLRADTLTVNTGPDGPRVGFEGGVRALSLEQVTEALGWPRFAGTFAGVIPRVLYDRGGLAVDGRLLVRVFDGEILLRDLRIRDLFGAIPVLEMSAEIIGIDLDLLTGAFDVGRVQGRLSGEVENLVLVDWAPQKMRLALQTPLDAPGHRRISQRAVQDLTELGGGLQAALSATFLSLFQEFPYRRLGFACALDGDVCLMSGVSDRPDGSYALVEGRGLPRLEVIGHNRRVDWPVLIRRLQAVRAEREGVVQ